MALIPPQFIDTVVAIGLARSEQDRDWIASGFLYGVHRPQEDPARYRIYLVTNRHVVAGLHGQPALVRCNPEGDAPAREYWLAPTTETGMSMWFMHPNEDIDIALTPVHFRQLREHRMTTKYFRSNLDAATTTQMLEMGVGEGDSVFVLGFPMGLIGAGRSAVVVRSGCIAQVRDALAGTSNRFLVDATVFPGNSGGPVVLRPDALAVVGTKIVDRSVLLGVVHSYVPYSDYAVSPQTGRTRVVFEENSGLSAVHPVQYIDEVAAIHLAWLDSHPTVAEAHVATPVESADQSATVTPPES